MNDKPTPWPVLAGTALWFAVLMTLLNWLRAGSQPPARGWAVAVAILVPGMVYGIWYERRRRDGDPDPAGEQPASRSFGDLPAVQRTRLLVVTVCGALMLLAMALLAALNAFTPGGSKASAGDWLFIVVLALLAALTPGWMWWRLLHPTRRMARQEDRLRKMHPARAYLPLLAFIPGTWISDLAFRAASPEPAKFAVAFVVNAVLGAVLVWLGETMRRRQPDREESPMPVW